MRGLGLGLGWVYAYRVPYSDASPKKWEGEGDKW